MSSAQRPPSRHAPHGLTASGAALLARPTRHTPLPSATHPSAPSVRLPHTCDIERTLRSCLAAMRSSSDGELVQVPMTSNACLGRERLERSLQGFWPKQTALDFDPFAFRLCHDDDSGRERDGEGLQEREHWRERDSNGSESVSTLGRHLESRAKIDPSCSAFASVARLEISRAVQNSIHLVRPSPRGPCILHEQCSVSRRPLWRRPC